MDPFTNMVSDIQIIPQFWQTLQRVSSNADLEFSSESSPLWYAESGKIMTRRHDFEYDLWVPWYAWHKPDVTVILMVNPKYIEIVRRSNSCKIRGFVFVDMVL